MPASKKRPSKATRTGEGIDFSDIPELDAEFWKNAKHVRRPKTELVTLRVKKDVLDHFKAAGTKGYQTRMNAVLESYVKAMEGKGA